MRCRNGQVGEAAQFPPGVGDRVDDEADAEAERRQDHQSRRQYRGGESGHQPGSEKLGDDGQREQKGCARKQQRQDPEKNQRSFFFKQLSAVTRIRSPSRQVLSLLWEPSGRAP